MLIRVSDPFDAIVRAQLKRVYAPNIDAYAHMSSGEIGGEA
jgi:hypothetical protein